MMLNKILRISCTCTIAAATDKSCKLVLFYFHHLNAKVITFFIAKFIWNFAIRSEFHCKGVFRLWIPNLYQMLKIGKTITILIKISIVRLWTGQSIIPHITKKMSFLTMVQNQSHFQNVKNKIPKQNNSNSMKWKIQLIFHKLTQLSFP